MRVNHRRHRHVNGRLWLNLLQSHMMMFVLVVIQYGNNMPLASAVDSRLSLE